MASDRPDPGEFLERAQRMLRDLFGDAGGDDEPPRGPHERTGPAGGHRRPSPAEQRENLTFALATRAVEALEDLALNVAAIRQRLERTAGQEPGSPGREQNPGGEPNLGGSDAGQ